ETPACTRIRTRRRGTCTSAGTRGRAGETAGSGASAAAARTVPARMSGRSRVHPRTCTSGRRDPRMADPAAAPAAPTAPPAEPAEDWREQAADALQRARRRTEALTDCLDEGELTSQHSKLMSPLAWDLAHVGNQEDQ